MSGLSLRLSECSVVNEQMQRGTLRNRFLAKLRERMAGATTFSGRLLRWLFERSRTVRQGDHSATSGILLSLLFERLSSPKLGSSRRHFGIVVRSLCWRSILTTYKVKKGGSVICLVYIVVAKLKKERNRVRLTVVQKHTVKGAAKNTESFSSQIRKHETKQLPNLYTTKRNRCCEYSKQHAHMITDTIVEFCTAHVYLHNKSFFVTLLAHTLTSPSLSLSSLSQLFSLSPKHINTQTM